MSHITGQLCTQNCPVGYEHRECKIRMLDDTILNENILKFDEKNIAYNIIFPL